MNQETQQAERIWQHTLSQVRITRNRRRQRRILVPLVCTGLVAAVWASWQPHSSSLHEIQVSQPPAPVTEPTLAVMRFNESGEAILEELTPSQLGSIELAFGQAPMLSEYPRE